MSTTVSRVVLELATNAKEFLADVSATANQAATKLETSFHKTGKSLKDFGKDIAPVSAAVGAIGIASIKMSMDMNEGMANVASLIPGNTKRVEELKKAIQDMAPAIGKSTGDLTDGLYQVISAFGDTNDSVKILDTNARAAAAGVATTTDAINLTSAVTKGYGDTSAAAVAKVSDLALLTVRLGQTTFPELASSIGRVTPLTSELGVAQEELFAVMATGTGVTGTASEVGTQLRGVLQGLMQPTEQMSDLFAKMGVESGKALLEQEGLKGAIDAIVGAAKDSGVPLGKYLGSIEGQTLALALAGAQSDTYVDKLGAMGNAAGATDAAFEAQTKGINASGFAWKQFQQEIAVAAQRLGDVAIPVLLSAATAVRPLVEGVMDLVEWVGTLPQPIQTSIVAVGALVAAAAPLLWVMGSLVSAGGTVIGMFGAKGVVTLALAGKYTILNTAMSLLGRAVPIVAAAFAGWQIGKWVGEVTGATAAVQSLTERILNLRDSSEPLESQQRVIAQAIKLGANESINFADALQFLKDKAAGLRAQHAETQAATEGVTGATDDAAQSARRSVAAFESAADAAKRKEAADKAAKDAAEAVERAIDAQAASLRSLGLMTERDVISQIQSLQGALTAAAREGADPLKRAVGLVIPELVELRKKAVAAGLSVGEIDHALQALRVTARDMASPIPTLNAQLIKTIPNMDVLAGKTRIVTSEMLRQRTETHLLGQAYETLGITTEKSLSASAEAARVAYRRISESGTATERDLREARQRVLEAEIEAGERTVSLWETQIEPAIKQAGQNILGSLSGNFTDMLTGAVGFKDGFINIWEDLKQTVKNILNTLLQTFLNEFLGGMLSGLMGWAKQAGSIFGGVASSASSMLSPSVLTAPGGAGAGIGLGAAAPILGGFAAASPILIPWAQSFFGDHFTDQSIVDRQALIDAAIYTGAAARANMTPEEFVDSGGVSGFSRGGEVFAGPQGMDARLHDHEAVFPLPDGFDLASSLEALERVADRSTQAASLPAAQNMPTPVVNVYLGNHQFRDYIVETNLRAYEENRGGGAPVGPTTRARLALGVA
jgi:TP901 family phage tail tape measure protein